MRKPIILSGLVLLATVAALPAHADELPLRKPGLWEMKSFFSTPGMPDEGVMHDCTDAKVDKAMMDVAKAAPTDGSCSKPKTQKTATGYSVDFECKLPEGPKSLHAEFTGDFNSAFKINIKTSGEKDQNIEAKWLSAACGPFDRPGDSYSPDKEIHTNKAD